MSVAAPAVSPRSGGAAASSSANAAGIVMPATGFDFALKRTVISHPLEGDSAGFERIVDHLYRAAHDPDSVKKMAGAVRRTVEHSLWQSARRPESRLPHIHAETFGRASLLFVTERLSRLALTIREWLVLLSAPKRLAWAVGAAWRGDDVVQSVREKATWYRVQEIAVLERDRPVPLVRLGDAVAANEDDWLASNPLLCVTKRYLAGEHESYEGGTRDGAAEMPVQSMVVIGKLVEIVARIAGHPPAGYRQELQGICEMADAIVADHEAARAEKIFRLKQAVTPALSKKESKAARQFWHPVVILACVLTLGALLLGAAGVEHLRWQGIVNQIDAEPGIEVISGSIAWGRRQMEVMRDPNAATVSELLLRYACDPASVIVRERPFVSADEAMTAARQNVARASMHSIASAPTAKSNADEDAVRSDVLNDVRLDLVRATLDLPTNVELTFTNGELTARGEIGEPGWSRLANSPKRFPWIKSLNVGQLRDLTGENIAKLQSSLEKYSIEFAPASAILPDASKLRLQSVASEMNMLVHDASLKRQTTRVQLCATDPSIDHATAEARAMLIRRDLERQGVPSSCFASTLELMDAPRIGTVGFRIVLEPFSDTP